VIEGDDMPDEYTHEASSPAELQDLSSHTEGHEEGSERVDMDVLNSLIERDYGSEEGTAEAETQTDEQPEHTDNEKTASETETSEVVEVDEAVYNAAKDLGLSEDQILELHDKSPSILEHLVNVKPVPKSPEPEPPAEPKSEDKPAEPLFTPEQVEALKKAGLEGPISKLVETATKAEKELESLRGRFTDEDRQKEMSAWRERLLVADKKMDEWAKINPDLGQTAELPRTRDGGYVQNDRRVRERSQIFKIATALFQAGAEQSWDDALDTAWAAYVGKHPELIEKKLVTEINSRRTKFSPRPSKKSARPAEQDFDSQMISNLASAIEKAG